MENGTRNSNLPASLSRRTTIAGVVVALSTAAYGQADGDAVTLDFARKALDTGAATVIDLREPQEHVTGVAKGVQLLPMRQLGARISEIPRDQNKPVLLICNTQNRSSATLKLLREKGYSNVRFVLGGMSEWNKRGWPMVKP